jgi:phosphoglycerate dehydrogenase-like enzyme
MTTDGPAVCVLPTNDLSVLLSDAVVAGGGRLTSANAARAVVWTDPSDAEGLAEVLVENPQLEWVQLPFAGVEPFVGVFDTERQWTCGKGVYSWPVAEHGLALILAGLRNLDGYARATSWQPPQGVNLLGANVVILGGGGIAEALISLLAPFHPTITVVRRQVVAMAGVDQVITPEHLPGALAGADVVVVALALTPETRHIIDASALDAMASHAVLVNLGRGGHVDTDALVQALEQGSIGGAGLDVTDPEPLPAGHPLWSLANCIITPHIANTPEMGRPLLVERVTENVRRFGSNLELVGPVSVSDGY